jgi:hypothetical protein
LSHRWCDNFMVAVGLVKLPHPEQVAPGESALSGVGGGDVAGEFVHHAIAPLGASDLAADLLADLPVEIDQGGVDCLISSLACGGDEFENFTEGTFRRGCGEIAHDE